MYCLLKRCYWPSQQCVDGTHSALQHVPEDEHEHEHQHHHHSHDHDHHHHEYEHEDNADDSVKMADIFIATAAVADYRTEEAAPQKIKKTQEAMTLSLVKNPDILATISLAHPELFCRWFCGRDTRCRTLCTWQVGDEKPRFDRLQ